LIGKNHLALPFGSLAACAENPALYSCCGVNWQPAIYGSSGNRSPSHGAPIRSLRYLDARQIAEQTRAENFASSAAAQSYHTGH
jgi:hypothetical protein